ncbi:MAG: adenosylcobinamide-GDP ribazoletransferase [Nitrospirae bacterium]|nr:adenosylcobinamide-GDP ribazoletransferase [Nitrospirota bacterium]
MKKLLLAFQFLTIIPMQNMGDVSEEEMGKTTAVFPLVGFAEGVVLAFLAALFIKVFPAELTNALLVLILVIMNGGLHLDGLSDTFDAVASRADRGKKLEIMKDSTVGPMGVIAIVMALLLKYVLLNTVSFQSTTVSYLMTVLAMPVLSRWSMVNAAFYSGPARKDGLGRLFIEHTRARQLIAATAAVIVLIALVCTMVSQFSLLMFYVMFAVPVLYAFSFVAVWFFSKMFGGMTGDSFGAVNELAVLIFLLSAVINNARLA